MIGQTLGHYRILDRLGSGGMGVVWLAEDLELGRKVALKTLRDDVASSPEKRARFEREARAVAALNHPNIVTLYAVEEADDQRFLTMEYVAGETLDERLRPGGLPLSDVLRFGSAVAAALAEAHAHGIVHRDLKPSNVLVGRDGRVRVVDFGLARALSPDSLASGNAARETSLTQDGLAVGTIHYMSPEQLQGRKIDQRSDLFALGIVLFEMATGALPFAGESAAQVITAVLRDPPRSLDELGSSLPPSFVDLVEELLAKEPQQRPPSAAAVHERLEAIAALLHSETEALPSAGRRRAARRPVRRRRAAVVAAAAIVAAALALGWFATRPRGAAPAAAAPVASTPAIAVLPLADYSASPDYFVEGMTDGLIGSLASFDGLRVISRQSVMQYRQSTKRLPEIAQELNVEYVLEGSLRRESGAVLLQLQLFRPDPEQQLWSEVFSGGESDLFALESQAARAVVAFLDLPRAANQRPRALAGAVAPAALEAYLHGHHLVEQGRPETVRLARQYFEEALRLEPRFAAAHGGLADVYGWLAFLYDQPGEYADKQEEEARRALELDPTLALAHAMLGDNYRYFHWDWARAEEEFRQAIALDPSSATARRSHWGLLASLGRLAEARAEIELAHRLDPLNAATESDLGFQRFFEGDLAEAERRFRRALELDASFPIAYSGLWALYDRQNRPNDRLEALRGWLVGFGYEDLARAMGKAGEPSTYPALARSIAEQLEARSSSERVLLGTGAALFASAGELDRAEAWLERAFRAHDPELVWLAMDPTWRELRARPRIRSMLTAMKLPLDAS